MNIRAKLIVTNILVFGLVLIAVAYIVYDRTRESELAKIDSRLEAYAAGFIAEFEDQWETDIFPNEGEFDETEIPPIPGIRIQLLDTSGQVVFSRDNPLPLSSNLLQQALHGMTLHQNININHEPYRLAVRPVAMDDHVGFVLVLAASMHDSKERLEGLALILLGTLAGALALSAFAVYAITKSAFRPMMDMVDAAERISAATLDHRLIIPTSRDEVRRLAEALNEMIQRIEDAFKSQRQFVADASHELRTPLTVIYSELEFLKRQLDDDRFDESMFTALCEIDRLTQLVQRLLLLTRIDAHGLTIERNVVRLDELLAEVVSLLQTASSENQVDIQPTIDDVIEIEGSSENLKRALINIVDNAVKYSPQGGSVQIVLRRETDGANIIISDQGPGIPADDIEHVFKRFYRSPKARLIYEGSGLGLPIAKELIEAQGGRISLNVPESGGTTVIIRLPLRLPQTR